jgi:hypothetical protein
VSSLLCTALVPVLTAVLLLLLLLLCSTHERTVPAIMF